MFKKNTLNNDITYWIALAEKGRNPRIILGEAIESQVTGHTLLSPKVWMFPTLARMLKRTT